MFDISWKLESPRFITESNVQETQQSERELLELPKDAINIIYSNEVPDEEVIDFTPGDSSRERKPHK